MRHLFIRGGYKPLGVSGESMIEAMLSLKPEIYGSIADTEKVELNGLFYIFQRLPKGIEECRYIKMISREGFEHSGFHPIIPSRRKRNCYRVDAEQMFVEITRGGSDIYDILTHLTFMYIEAEKIRKNSMDTKGRKNRAWTMLEEICHNIKSEEEIDIEVGLTYLSTVLGRTYEEVSIAYQKFEKEKDVHNLFHITYWLGKLSMEEHLHQKDREITFSSQLRDMLGHHVYGEKWAKNIKAVLIQNNWLKRPIHIISANLHSIMNCFYTKCALADTVGKQSIMALAEILSASENRELRSEVEKFALDNGMIAIDDTSGTNIGVQIFDTATLDIKSLPEELHFKICKDREDYPIIIVMDYAFGEQAYETMDELLKPVSIDGIKTKLKIKSINIMGKAGILVGDKGDIMIPNAHVFEGTADNYPFENELTAEQFKDSGLGVYTGSMITVLGTSLQNKDILEYFLKSSWAAVGLEMEGAHYQKAIQAAVKIRNSVENNLKVRYAYYASDNPLETGSTLASGSLGLDGVKPTYLITIEMLKSCFEQ
jgi:hypothetical protein